MALYALGDMHLSFSVDKPIKKMQGEEFITEKDSVVIYTFSGAHLEFQITDIYGNWYSGYTTVAVAGDSVYLYLNKLTHYAEPISDEQYLRDYFGQ